MYIVSIENIVPDKISILIISYSLRDAETTTSKCNLLQIIGKVNLIFNFISRLDSIDQCSDKFIEGSRFHRFCSKID